MPAISRKASLGEAGLLTALLVLVAMVYWSGLHGGFVFDDYPNIVDNVALHVTWDSTWPQWVAAVFSSPASDMQRPFAMATFAVNHALTGLDPYWMKLTNLGIHLLNTVLVFGLVNRVLQAADVADPARPSARRELIALWVAAAWALNPINLMAVLLVVQRMECLCHTFVFAGLWLYLIARERLYREGRGWPMLLVGVVGCTMIGALAKESAVLLPLYALAIEWTFLGFATKGRGYDWRLLALYGAVLVLPAVVGLAWLLPSLLSGHAYVGRNFSLGERLLTEPRVVIDYLHWTLLPNLSQLSLYHDDYPLSHGLLSPPTTALALLLLAALIGTMYWLRQRRPLMALGVAWFLAAQLLTGTIIPLELVYEHRNYFASLGLCLALADGLLRAPQRQVLRRLGWITAALLLALYAGLTALRTSEWQDPLRFALAEAAKHANSPRANYDVARDFILLSDYDSGSPYVDRAFASLDRAMRLPGATPLPEAAAIILAARTGREVRPGWWYSLQDKLRDRPIGPQETNALASLADCQLRGYCRHQAQELQDSFAAALKWRREPEILSIYGNYALNALNNPALALRLWQEAAQRAPRVAQYQVSLAKLLIASGQPELAQPYIDNLRRLGNLGQNEAIARELEQLATQSKLLRNGAR